MKLVSFIYQGETFYVNPQYVTLVQDDQQATTIYVVGYDRTLYVDEPITAVVKKIEDALQS